MRATSVMFVALAVACTRPLEGDEDLDGFRSEDGDCDDADPSVNPDATELACNNVDDDCNGEIDDGVGAWRPVRTEGDDDGDGVPDYIGEWDYRPDGQLEAVRQDWDGDGTWDATTTYTYDALGHLAEMVYRDVGGERLRVTFETDAEGRTTEQAYDLGDNGTVDEIYGTVYDAVGHLVMWRADYDADGVWDYVEAYRYVGDHYAGYCVDDDGDGTWDAMYLTDFNAAGKPIADRYDYDGDGVWDFVNTYTYDAAGRLLSSAEDADGDGQVDTLTTYDTDDRGHVLRAEVDYGNDGEVDRIYEQAWLVDVQILYREDNGADGAWDYVWEVEVVDGRVAAQRTDDEGDGFWDHVATYTYDGDEISRIEWDEDGDGVVDRVVEYDHDGFGNFLGYREDRDNDGVWDNSYAYDWSCEG